MEKFTMLLFQHQQLTIRRTNNYRHYLVVRKNFSPVKFKSESWSLTISFVWLKRELTSFQMPLIMFPHQTYFAGTLCCCK